MKGSSLSGGVTLVGGSSEVGGGREVGSGEWGVAGWGGNGGSNSASGLYFPGTTRLTAPSATFSCAVSLPATEDGTID